MNVAPKLPDPENDIAAFRREIPSYKDVIRGELAQSGDWIVTSISTDSFWPITSQKVRWRGVDIWIMSIMKGFYPAVAMKVPPGKSRTECEELVLRFLSTLSWVEERGFMVEGGGLSGGNLPRRGLNHVGYAFLSFYKILETAFPKDAKRIAWISTSIAGLSGIDVKEALDGIRAQGITTPEGIGAHLFKSGRWAMAHGARKPIVDPDKPGDLRLGSELPIVRALAVKAIRGGVWRRDTRDELHTEVHQRCDKCEIRP